MIEQELRRMLKWLPGVGEPLEAEIAELIVTYYADIDRSFLLDLMARWSHYPPRHTLLGKGKKRMDGPKFDDLTRAFGQGTSRRTLLRGVAGGVAGVLGRRGGADRCRSGSPRAHDLPRDR